MDIEAARTVARETVSETFLALGVDLKKPGEVVEVQQDFAFNRSARLIMQKVRYTVITALVTSITGGMAALIWKMISTAKAGG